MAGQPGTHDEVDLVAVAHQVIALWPVGTFVENIAILSDGDFAVSVHNRHELHRVTTTGQHHRWVCMPAAPAGLVAVPDGLFVVGGEPGEGPHHLWHVTLSGDVADVAAIADTQFLNGFTPGRWGYGYTVDSIEGTVIEVELATGAAEVVLRAEQLQKCSPELMLPGANGIKATEDALVITNTDRALVLAAALDRTGRPTGAITTIAENLRGDDLAVASDGNLFITNHIHNTVIRLNPHTGERVAVAGPDQGMAGSTACVFGAAPEQRTSLFVTTTGGIVMPLNGVVQEAKLVRLDVAVTGRAVTFLGSKETP